MSHLDVARREVADGIGRARGSIASPRGVERLAPTARPSAERLGEQRVAPREPRRLCDSLARKADSVADLVEVEACRRRELQRLKVTRLEREDTLRGVERRSRVSDRGVHLRERDERLDVLRLPREKGRERRARLGRPSELEQGFRSGDRVGLGQRRRRCFM